MMFTQISRKEHKHKLILHANGELLTIIFLFPSYTSLITIYTSSTHIIYSSQRAQIKMHFGILLNEIVHKYEEKNIFFRPIP